MVGWMVERAQDGADWAKHSLGLLPCQLWSLMRGRTTWLAGDSISQVRPNPQSARNANRKGININPIWGGLPDDVRLRSKMIGTLYLMLGQGRGYGSI